MNLNSVRGDLPLVSGLRAARIPATVVAMAALIGASVSNAQDSGERPIIQAVDTVHSSAAAESSPQQTEEVSEDTVLVPVVDYYRQTCPALYEMVAVSDKVSGITENAIGQSLVDEKVTHADGIDDIVSTISGAGTALRDIPAPKDLPGSDDTMSAAYEAAVNRVADQAGELAGGLEPLAGDIRDAGDDSRLDDLVGQYRGVVDAHTPALTSALNDLVAVAGPSTSATGDAVRSLPECAPVFEPSPQPSDDMSVGSAVDLHVRLTQAENLVRAGSEKISSIAADTEGATFEEGRAVTVDAWRARASAAQQAIDLIEGWEQPSTPTAAEANALIGYPEVRADAVGVYTSVRDAANASADSLAAAEGVSDLNEALTSASETTWESSVAEAKLLVRVARNAPVPTTASADDIQRIVSEHPTP